MHSRSKNLFHPKPKIHLGALSVLAFKISSMSSPSTIIDPQPSGASQTAINSPQGEAGGPRQSAIPDRASDSEVLVRVNGVSKNFRRDLKKSIWYGMKDVASELLPFGKASKTGRADRAPSADSLSNYKFKIQNFHRPASGLLNFGR